MSAIPGVKVKLSRYPKGESALTGNPNDWFAEHFERAARDFGGAFLFANHIDANQFKHFVPIDINIDFFAAVLRGSAELGHDMVYYQQAWYFLDPELAAYCATTPEKVEAYLSNFMIRCAQEF